MFGLFWSPFVIEIIVKKWWNTATTLTYLTNQIIGVLIRFRQESIAIIADMELMFYQEHVPEKHQSFLRFIWCEQNNLGCSPSDHQMCFHVFGGTFSPSCCNFPLKQTSKKHRRSHPCNCANFTKELLRWWYSQIRREWRSCNEFGQEYNWYVPGFQGVSSSQNLWATAETFSQQFQKKDATRR